MSVRLIDEVKFLREENVKLKAAKDHLLEVLIETMNALIRTQRRRK